VDSQWFNSVTNVECANVGDESFAIETHLLDFHPIERHRANGSRDLILQWRRAEIKFLPSMRSKSRLERMCSGRDGISSYWKRHR